MFWNSNKKIYWKDLWKSGFVDIHNHLLWGIDDGSKTFEETMLLCEMMQDLGITEAIATPHTYPGLWNNEAPEIENAYQAYATRTSDLFITHVSSEYLADTYLSHLEQNQTLLSLPNRYLLIEFSLLAPPNDFVLNTLFQLKLKGYRLILAHPERYLYWKKTLGTFERLKSFDLYYQMNTLSLIGYYGIEVKRLCEYLLSKGFYDFTGTDTHNKKHLLFTAKNAMHVSSSTLQSLETIVEASQLFKKPSL